jgi:beta-fructofuranosidase
MLVLPDAWTWDFWLADDGARYHVFFLRASRALLDPALRHRRAGIGHAVSGDLRRWTLLPDALVHADPPAFDDLATWTGSVTRDPASGWRMFYTGISHAEGGQVQRIGSAHSADLTTWHRSTARPLEADPRWYAKREPGRDGDEAWRDPWVYRDPAGRGWHMLVTACAAAGAQHDRGVIGHAVSADLRHWTARPPLSQPGAGFGHLEVLQVEVVDGRPVLIFSCLGGDMPAERRSGRPPGGIWAAAGGSALGPFDVAAAWPLTGPELYAGRLIRDRGGQWVLLAFRNAGRGRAWAGGLSDPLPVRWESPPGGPVRLRAGEGTG